MMLTKQQFESLIELMGALISYRLSPRQEDIEARYHECYKRAEALCANEGPTND